MRRWPAQSTSARRNADNGSRKSPHRNQSVFRILRSNQNNIEIPRQRAMLKAVIEQMKLRPEFRLGKKPGFVPVFSHDHRRLQLARHQQRLIAELLRQPCRIDQPHARGLSPVSPRQHIKFDSARLEQLAQQHHKRSLSRSPRRNIPDADHAALQPARPQHSPVIERIPRAHHAAVDG